MATVVITGAGRGIGAELCRQAVAGGDRVVACPRSDDAPELDPDTRRRARVVPLDVADEPSIARAGREIAAQVEAVDLLIHNAGVYPRENASFDRLDPECLVRAFQVNALGPLRVTAALLPLLRRGRKKRVAALTSRMGSIDDNRSGGSYAYRMSKAALNMAVRNLAHELGREGFVVLAIHPGWVRTRMGGGDRAPLALDQAAAEVLRLARHADPALSGAMVGPGAERIPW
ncbi:MAG TPA: SDR family oxidoreductase [Candidatus Polarisedimenticolaceae bacterium]|nr:SDR family oxidoreductase [Candidatus Polarisedimenticolaceae bacterium]